MGRTDNIGLLSDWVKWRRKAQKSHFHNKVKMRGRKKSLLSHSMRVEDGEQKYKFRLTFGDD